jgi:WD40 repeat protein
VDCYGDPLPVGAVVRLGTVRWRHGDGTAFVSFPPGGKEVLSVGHDGTVRQWDVATGKETRRFTLPAFARQPAARPTRGPLRSVPTARCWR